ncbi:MAG: autotransporter-associated beta strand repeat-containing protein [Kiritimatiellia bacterium]|jgi:autotransporter-associated beta strand protein
MKPFTTTENAKCVLCLFALMVAWSMPSAQAANPADWKTFTSSTKRNWSDADSWTAGTGVPTPGDSLVINFDPSKTGTATSGGKISQSFDATNNLGTLQLNTLNLSGESSGSARTIRVYDGALQFCGESPSINDTTSGADNSIKYQLHSSLLLDADLNLNLNGTGELTLLGIADSTLSASSAGLKTITATGAGKSYLGANSSAAISDGLGQIGLALAGTGTLTIGGQNTFTGGILIKSGTLRQNSSSAGSAHPTLAFGAGLIRLGDTAAGNANATLQFTAGGSGFTCPLPITVQAGNSGVKTIENAGGNLTVTLGGLLALEDDATIAYTGSTGGGVKLGNTSSAEAVAGTNDLHFYNSGTLYHQILGNSPNFTGGVVVHTGALRINSDAALNAFNTVAVASGAALYSNNRNQTIAGLDDVDGAGGEVAQTGSNARTLTLGGSGTYAFSGSIGATTPANLALTVALTGNGAQTLGGDCTYEGATTIDSGTLLVDGSLAAGSAVTVGANGTLGGTGTVNGATTIYGALSPAGTGVGTLTLAGDAVFAEDAAYDWGCQNKTGDAVVVAGDLRLPAAATINVAEGEGKAPDPGVLFQAGSLSGASSLSGWTVSPDTYSVAIQGSSVLLIPPPDPRTVLVIQ